MYLTHTHIGCGPGVLSLTTAPLLWLGITLPRTQHIYSRHMASCCLASLLCSNTFFFNDTAVFFFFFFQLTLTRLYGSYVWGSYHLHVFILALPISLIFPLVLIKSLITVYAIPHRRSCLYYRNKLTPKIAMLEAQDQAVSWFSFSY